MDENRNPDGGDDRRLPVEDRGVDGAGVAQGPGDQSEEDVGEASQGGMDQVSQPHGPRTHQEVEEDTLILKSSS